jgi:phosphate binding protein
MQSKTQMKRLVPALGLVAAIGLAGSVQAQTVSLPKVDPNGVTGNIGTGGSSTVFPLTQEMAVLFKADGYDGNITVDSIGSGAGIQRFCRGEYDIANASRAMTEAEIANCKAAGRNPLQTQVGIDALTVVVNPQNTWTRSLSKRQLALIFSGQAKSWKDVDSRFPDVPIKLFSPGTDSGTYDYFTEHVFVDASGRALPNRRDIIPQVPGVQLSENDNVLVQGVAGDKGAIGYFGFAYFNENRNRLKAVAFEGVAPNAATVQNGRYGFARPLFVITTPGIMVDKPQVEAFLNYYLTNVDKAIRKVGYFPMPAATLNKQKQAFLDAVE